MNLRNRRNWKINWKLSALSNPLFSVWGILWVIQFFVLILAGSLSACKGRSASVSNPVPPTNSANNKPLPLSRAEFCLPVDSEERIEPLNFGAPSGSQGAMPKSKEHSFVQLADALRPHCAGCHQAPLNKSGAFTYADSHSDTRLPNGAGQTDLYSGIAASAEKIHAALASGSMPPAQFKMGNEAELLRVQSLLADWIAAGKPDGKFNTRTSDPLIQNKFEPLRRESTDLGDCIPQPAAVGFDLEKDAIFESLNELPHRLSDTDYTTLDTFELAKRGTVAYNTEYPLWADSAKKIRMVHFPAKKTPEGVLVRHAAVFDNTTRMFAIPDNARFYKSFFKDVKQVDGQVRQRIVETRLIVVRAAPRVPLFGTYQWNAEQTDAILLNARYRDGTPWKDVVVHIDVDESLQANPVHTPRLYALPGKQRCVDCHQGADSFTLGFTPLQLNRRKNGDAGSERSPGVSELTQIERLAAFGFLSGFARGDVLPKLETMGREPPANVHAARVQGYFVGNCANCHNPNGSAMKDTNVKLDLSAGKLFPFEPVAPAEGGAFTFLGPAGDLNQSVLFNRISRTQNTFGKSASPMPMHIAGGPDCRLVNLVGKWLKSFESLESANNYTSDCRPAQDVKWLDLDFTSQKSAQYVPKRADWNSKSVTSMPEHFRNLPLSDALLAVSRKKFPTGYFLKKSDSVCNFPKIAQPADAPAWANRQRNWGEAYFQTPGSFYYASACAHCHGRKGNGQSGLSTSLLYYSNGAIQVADFSQGLFGNALQNLNAFNVVDAAGKTQNLAPQYLVWMAFQGTLFNFPGDLDSYLGKGHANMLFSLGERCGLLLRTPRAGQLDPESAPDAALNKEVCTLNNPITPEVGFDAEGGAPINLEAQNAWKNRASFNAALSVFTFLKEQAFAPGEGFSPREKECEKVFPTVR